MWLLQHKQAQQPVATAHNDPAANPQIKQRRCVPVYLPAYIFEYRYLGLPWRAIVGGTTLAVGGETHRSPFKIAGMVLVAGIVTKMPLPILPAALASGAAVALWPAVQKFIKGMERRAERSRDKSSSSSKSTRCRDQCIQLCSRTLTRCTLLCFLLCTRLVRLGAQWRVGPVAPRALVGA